MGLNNWSLGWACRRKLYRATVQNEVLDSEMDFLIQVCSSALLVLVRARKEDNYNNNNGTAATLS
jgi:hypothetical protein